MCLLLLLITSLTAGGGFYFPAATSVHGRHITPAITLPDTLIKANNPLKTDLDKKADSSIQMYFAGNSISNLSIGILTADQTTSYGYTRLDSNQLSIPTDKSIFEIGSITKTFTATLLAKYIVEGKVKADDAVNRYLPDSIPALQFNGKSITLMHLANHSSGLPRMPMNVFFNSNPGDPYSHYKKEQLFSFLKTFKPNKEPATVYEYSNLAVGLLGVVLEKVSGKTFETLLLENICEPLNMRHTVQHIATSGIVMGFNAAGKPALPWNFQALAAAGCIRSNVSDMLLYAKAQVQPATGELGKAIHLSHQITFTKETVRVAMGWHVLTINQNEYLVHEGQTGGYCSVMVFNPKTSNAVVALVNGAASPGKPALQIIHWLDNRK